MTPLESQFMTILHAHCGLRNAISVPAMAAKLGLSNRMVQEIKKSLVEHHGINIGSSCGKRSGWFLCETQAEVDSTLKQYRNRVKSLCVLIAKTTAAANRSGVMRQLALEFEQEEQTYDR
jgi:hypothetical protein